MRKDINRMEKEIEQKKKATKSKKARSCTGKGGPGLSELCDGDVEESSGIVEGARGGKQSQVLITSPTLRKNILF